MLDIVCPECGSTGSISLIQSVYEGPYRCWKCRNLFQIRIDNEELSHCVPMSQDEFDRWEQERKSSGD